MRIAIFIISSLILTTLAPLAAAQNDGGSGADAPSSRSAALPFPDSHLQGFLDDSNGDSADWYLMTGLPAGKGLSVDLNTNGVDNVIIYLLDEDGNPFIRNNGQLISGYRIDNFWGGPARYHFDIIPSVGVFYLGVVTDFWSNQGTYDFNFATVDLADLAVNAITVDAVTVQSDAGPLPISLVRKVSVTVENHGAAAAPSTIDVWVTPVADPRGARRHVGTATVNIGVGETKQFTFEWQTTGEIGDMDVHARASTYWESTLADNEAALRQFVIVGSTGLGVDLLNHNVKAAGASAGTSFGRGTGAGVTLPVGGTTTVGQYDP